MYTMGKVLRNLISSRNSFEVKVANERFIIIDSRCRQTLNLEISCSSFVDYVKEMH